MPRVLYAAAPWWAGTWHRFRVMNHVKAFADSAGYRVYFLWGVSSAVAYCRFEDLLSPVPGVQVVNVSEQELLEVERATAKSKSIRFGNQGLAVYHRGGALSDSMFAFDIAAGEALEHLARCKSRLAKPIYAIPAPEIRRQASAHIRNLDLSRRVGIRVRVTECNIDGRKPRRRRRELDDTVRSIIRMPWHVRVFVVTDSEYIQQMLASHFHDTRFLAKRFDERDIGGWYVGRQDRDSMVTFLTEVACLTSCRKIVNVGGFLNQESVRAKIIEIPSRSAVAPVQSQRK